VAFSLLPQRAPDATNTARPRTWWGVKQRREVGRQTILNSTGAPVCPNTFGALPLHRRLAQRHGRQAALMAVSTVVVSLDPCGGIPR